MRGTGFNHPSFFINLNTNHFWPDIPERKNVDQNLVPDHDRDLGLDLVLRVQADETENQLAKPAAKKDERRKLVRSFVFSFFQILSLIEYFEW